MRKYVNLKFDNGLAVIRIDNPPVNALSQKACKELIEVINEIDSFESQDETFDKKKIEVVIISAADNNNVFIAGADINMFLDLKTKKDGENMADFCHGVIDPIANIKVPVICAVNGLALGGGTEVALASDIRVASENAKLGLTEVQLGVIPGGGGTQRLSRLVGPGKAKDIIFTGRKVGAAEAYQIGLVDRIVKKGEAFNEALKIAGMILKNSPAAVKNAKMAIDKGLDLSLEKGLEIEKKALGLACESGEQIEGAKAFLEKRKPKYL